MSDLAEGGYIRTKGKRWIIVRELPPPITDLLGADQIFGFYRSAEYLERERLHRKNAHEAAGSGAL